MSAPRPARAFSTVPACRYLEHAPFSVPPLERVGRIAHDFPAEERAYLAQCICIGIAKGDDVFRFKDDDKVLAITTQRHASLWLVQHQSGRCHLRPASPSLFDVRHALRDDLGYLQYRLAKLRMPRHLELKVITIYGQFLAHSSKALDEMIDLLNG